METGEDPQPAHQRVRARRSTVAGLGGIALVALGLLLTAAHVLGDVVPTVLAIVGVGSLVAGVSTGTMQVVGRPRHQPRHLPPRPRHRRPTAQAAAPVEETQAA